MQVLVATGERFKLNPRATSDIMKIMGFIERDRSNSGSLLPFEKETVGKIHRLKRIHNVQWPESENLKVQTGKCNFCKEDQAATLTESSE